MRIIIDKDLQRKICLERRVGGVDASSSYKVVDRINGHPQLFCKGKYGQSPQSLLDIWLIRITNPALSLVCQ